MRTIADVPGKYFVVSDVRDGVHEGWRVVADGAWYKVMHIINDNNTGWFKKEYLVPLFSSVERAKKYIMSVLPEDG